MSRVLISIALAGCAAAVDLDAEEPVAELCPCNNPANFVRAPRAADERARWERFGEAMVEHGATLGAIFDRVCPDLRDTRCLVELDRQLAPHAERSRALLDALVDLDAETCGGFTRFYALDTPVTPDGRGLISLLRASDVDAERLVVAMWLIDGYSRGPCCPGTIEPP